MIEQAKGVLAEKASVSVDEAFQMLRSYARQSNGRLHDIAQALIAGTIKVQDLTNSAPGVAAPA